MSIYLKFIVGIMLLLPAALAHADSNLNCTLDNGQSISFYLQGNNNVSAVVNGRVFKGSYREETIGLRTRLGPETFMNINLTPAVMSLRYPIPYESVSVSLVQYGQYALSFTSGSGTITFKDINGKVLEQVGARCSLKNNSASSSSSSANYSGCNPDEPPCSPMHHTRICC